MTKKIVKALAFLHQAGPDQAVTFHPDGTALSYVFDETWDFSGHAEYKVNYRTVVSFTKINISYRKEIQVTLLHFMQQRYKQESERATVAIVESWKQGLVNIREALGSSDWAMLSDDRLYRRFKHKIKQNVVSKNLSQTLVDSIVRVINTLRVLGFCNRIARGKEFRAMVIREKEQYIAIPIGMYQPILAQALAVVEKYHPYRHTINHAMAKAEQIYQRELNRKCSRKDNSSKLGAVSARFQREIKKFSHGVPNFSITRNGTELNRIISACALTVLAFSGVRLSELLSMSKSSYRETGAKRIPTLVGEETKRLGHVVHESWQTHPVAKDALELAYDATQYLRDMYHAENEANFQSGTITNEKYAMYKRQLSSAFLAVKTTMRSSAYVASGMSKKFTDLIEFWGITAKQADIEEFDRLNPARHDQMKVGGTLPKMSPHDFRRSFAVFFKRYGFGSSATIKFQYKHGNIQMSDYYANNAKLQAMEDVLMDRDLLHLMNEEAINMGVDAYYEIYNESEHLGGAAGERIAKDKFERLSERGGQAYFTREEIEVLVRNGTLSIVRLPSGLYCTNKDCSRISGIGEFSTGKKPCEHIVITDKQAKQILKKTKRLIKKFRALNTGDKMNNSILIALKQKIKNNEKDIEKFNLAFEPFSDKVKGAIKIVEV